MKINLRNLTGAALACVAVWSVTPTTAQADPMLGEIRFFAGDFAPRGWEFCEGQVIPIDSNASLFSVIGPIYGGDGRTTFALPDMRGRAPVHRGRGPGLEPVQFGQVTQPGTDSGTDLKSTPWLGTRCIIAVRGYFPDKS